MKHLLLKKTFIFAITMLLVVSMIASCNPGSSEVSNTSENSSSNSLDESDDTSRSDYVDEEGNYKTKREIIDWDEREFRILVRGSAFATYQSDDFTTDSELYGDLLNDAVQKRNDRIEEDYNVKLVVIKSDTINSDITADYTAGLGQYDAVMPALGYLAILAQDGMLLEMSSIENFDLSAPWFDQNATEAFSVSNKVYFTTGDITILNKVCTPSILFNKDMIDKYNLDNPYELVRNHEWTFDKMVEMAKTVAEINNPDDLTSTDNVYGMMSSYGDVIGFFGAANQKICGKDGDDLPYLTINDQKSIDVIQKVLATLSDETWCVFAQEYPDPIWVTSFATFLEGRALFRFSGFSATTKARQQSDLNFGILPSPLWDTDQENYCSYCGSGEVAGIAIPKACVDPDFSAYMIEVCSAEAKNTITKAYYEVNLQQKDTRDEESLEMLDIIFDNIIYDVGEVNNFGGIKQILQDLMAARSTDIVSKLDSVKEMMQTEISEIIESYNV